MEVKCINCFSDLVLSEYDYNTGLTIYECSECGTQFTNNDIVYCDNCGEQITNIKIIDNDNMVFCSETCKKQFNE